ncbi:MAG: AraC family transcriptional regulator [Alistipes senegalensis]|nr:AraC family transcriptional regulator [Bacteroides cellulosilyticus]MCM1351190.1 AraC family transcriptional regulator [Alistipes senegalensis]
MNDESEPRRSSAAFKYLIANDQDLKFNAVVNAVGSQRIVPHSEYPLHVHPADYFFDPSKGRVLHEWQLLYITQGKGTFRSARTSAVPVNRGTMILLRPGELHSYQPQASTGWTEYYIGFEGRTFDRMLQLLKLDGKEQLWEIGLNNELTQLYERAFEIASDQKIAPQPLLSGIVCHMLGLLNFLIRNRTNNAATDLLEQAVEKAKIIMDSKVTEEIDLAELSSELNMSYSWFRKTFKEYTGLSPAKYFQQLKLRRAQRMLSDTQLSVKEIAYSLGYKSTEHFFSIFKKSTGHTPLSYRNYGRD